MRGPFDSLLMRARLCAGSGVTMTRVLVRTLFLLAPRTLPCGRLLLESCELNDRELGRVAAAKSELYHSRITARAILVTRRNLIEELFDRLMGLEVREGAAARGEVALLAQRY